MQQFQGKRYSLSKAAAAAGISIAAVNKWIAEGRVPMDHEGDNIATGKGRERTITIETVVYLIVMGELSRRKVPLDVATKAAKQFAFSGIGGAAKFTGDTSTKDALVRMPSELYSGARTLISIFEGDDGETTHKLIREEEDASAAEAWRGYFRTTQASPVSVTVVDVGWLLVRRLTLLNVDVTSIRDRMNGEA